MNAAAILAGGVALVRNQPKALAIWGAVYLAARLAMMALIWPMFAALAVFQQQAMAAQAANLPPPSPPTGFFGAIFLIDGALLVLFAVIFAASVRAVASGGKDAFGFLRLGMDELRLVGLGLLLILLCIVGTIVLAIAMAIVLVIAGMLFGGGSTSGAVAAAVIFIVVLYAVIIWAQVRMSLAGALTVLRGRIVIREAWRATRGRFWTLFGVYLLIGVTYSAITIALVAIGNPGLLSAYAGGMDPETMQAAIVQQQAMMADPFGPRLIATLLIGAVTMTIGVAFTFGAVATAAIGFDHEAHGAGAEALD